MTTSETASEITLTIPPKAEFLTFCRLVLTALSRSRHFDAETLADLKLAVTEACSNSIRHAYPNGRSGEVEVRYAVDGDAITIEVLDSGPDFEPAEPRPRSELSEDGMGISIIRALVDELDVRRGPDGTGNQLRFTKYLR